MSSSNQIASIPFHGDTILTTMVDGKPYVAFRHACESIGLNAKGQLAKLRNRSWFNWRDIAAVAADGKARSMVVVAADSLPMWLATVNEAKVDPAVREKLGAYQRESAQAINDYWTKGGTVNPRASEDQRAALVNLCTAQFAMLQAARGLVPDQLIDVKARMVIARGLGEEPDIDPATRPLTVGEFLDDKGVGGAALRSMSSTMGKRIAALYLAKHGAQPPKVDRLVDNAMRKVCSYTEADRPLFEEAYAARKGEV